MIIGKFAFWNVVRTRYLKLDPKLCNYQGRSRQPLLHLAVLSCRDAGRKSFPISARREVVDLLLRAPLLDIELRDRWGHSAGMIALKLYDFLPSGEQGIAVAILEQLMERGLDVLGTDAQGTDLLQMAAAGHNILALKALLAQLQSEGREYPVLSRRDTRGRTLLHHAVGQLKDAVVGTR